MSAWGLGRAETQAPAACVEYLGGIAYRESQILLGTYGSTQRRILFESSGGQTDKDASTPGVVNRARRCWQSG
jgi:hypothetical protein